MTLKLKLIKINFKALLFCFLIYFPISGSCYNLEKIEITPFQFKNYVIPQLKNIINDFYSVIKTYNDENVILKNKNKYNEIKLMAKKAFQKCPVYISQNCIEDVKNILKITKYYEIIFLEQMLSDAIKVEMFLDEFNVSHDLSTVLTKLSLHLESVVSTINMAEDLENNKIIYIQNLLGEMGIYFHHYMITQVPAVNYEQFKVFWMQFIYPIEEKIIQEDRLDYFKYNITSFNSIWHDFNMFFLKKEQNVPKKIETYLNTINNRWNAILRISLDQN